MITFCIAVILLVLGYWLYSKVIERIIGVDPQRVTPAVAHPDGVDYVPMKPWRIFLIQFLNIAGVGPICGAIMGAQFGTASFLWIVFGCIFAGAVHDFIAGFVSIRQDGASLPEIHGKYLGNGMKQFMRGFTVLLMILVGAVFVNTPAVLLNQNFTPDWNIFIWVGIIFAYYLLATLLPIDKVIGKIYPIFGILLLAMAVAIVIAFVVYRVPIPEIWSGLENRHPNAATNPIFPMMFISIACGAISGFHATQSPLMARCMVNEKQARPIFYGAMITEGVVALIWAAAATYFFHDKPELCIGKSGNDMVGVIANVWFPKVIAVICILGVISAAVTSGDTALRSARLIVADFMHVDQKPIPKRLLVALPVFVLAAGLLVFSLIDKEGFQVIWRYFSWANQFLAMVTLWAITVFLSKHKPGTGWYWITLIPALFMSMVTISFLLVAQKEGLGSVLPRTIGYGIAAVITAALGILFFIKKNKRTNNTKKQHSFCVCIILITCSAALSIGCTREDSSTFQDGRPKTTGMHLGNQIKNIYATRNMRDAYNKKHLNFSSTSLESIVKTTHLYVKLHPIDTLQAAIIVDDTSIHAFPYPLDYEILGGGEYVQPTVDSGWVYAVVPINWAGLSSINYVLLDSCCIPKENETELLEIEQEELLKIFGPGVEKVSGKPKGYIKVENTSTGQYDGMRRVKVVMNTIVRVHAVYTNDNGYYEYTGWPPFITNVNYTILFENIHDFKVWNHHNGFSSILPNSLCLGVHSPKGYNYNIKRSDSINWRAATICNAASVYYNHLWKETDLNIGRPIGGLRIGFMPIVGNWTACTPMWRHRIYSPTEWYQYLALFYVTMAGGLVLPDMMVWTDTWSTDSIYSTIFHELAHVSHYRQVGNTYWDSFVSNIIANGGYGDGNSHSDYVGVGEMWAYYAEVVAYNRYRTYYAPSMPDMYPLGVPNYSYWFKPQYLDSLTILIPNYSITDIFNCMNSTNTNHCDFCQTIKNQINNDYCPIVDYYFSSLCSNK